MLNSYNLKLSIDFKPEPRAKATSTSHTWRSCKLENDWILYILFLKLQNPRILIADAWASNDLQSYDIFKVSFLNNERLCGYFRWNRSRDNRHWWSGDRIAISIKFGNISCAMTSKKPAKNVLHDLACLLAFVVVVVALIQLVALNTQNNMGDDFAWKTDYLIWKECDESKQNWMQGWQYGKRMIYLVAIFRLTKLAFLRARRPQVLRQRLSNSLFIGNVRWIGEWGPCFL